jgi:diguanylate cyclase
MVSVIASSFAISTMDIALMVVASAVGAGAGWLLASLRKVAADNKAADHAQLVIERLKLLATSMAANVDEHTSRVQEINTDLQAQYAEGSDEYVVNSISKIIAANSAMQNKLKEAENRLQEQAVEIETQFTAARTDQLTRVANRRAFDDTLAECYKLWTKKGVPFSTMMIDVDFFKKFNDSYGHQAGDEVLIGVAAALTKAMRDKDLVARYGGEEFAVIFPQTKLEDALPAAERARKAIEESTFPFEGQNLKVTASVGLAQIRSTDTAELVLKNADAGLYASKQAGRNCSHYHDGAKFVPLTPRIKEAAAANSTNHPSAAETGRASFEDELRRRVAECQRFDVPLSVVRIEVDNFSSARANFGPAGDRVVMEGISELLQSMLREMDLATETHAGQISVMLPGSEVGDAVGVAERIRSAIAKHNFGDKEHRVTASLGITQVVPCDDVAALLGRVEKAVAASHAAAGNQCHLLDGKQIEPVVRSGDSE